MKTLIVRSGGGLPGLDVHVGYWLALARAGVIGTSLCGTSAGAIISALDLYGWTAIEAFDYITGLRDSDVRDERPFWRIRFPFIESVFYGSKMRSMINDLLRMKVRERSVSYFGVYSVRVSDGEIYNLSNSTKVADAVIASCSVPVLFPAAYACGSKWVDGGVAANFPLPDDWSSYDRVVLCDATLDDGKALDAGTDRDTTIRSAITAIRLAMRAQATRARKCVRMHPNGVILSLRGQKDHGLMRFDHSLIELATNHAVDVLKGKGWM